MSDDRDLQRFVAAQRACYDAVCAELRAGRKRSHWMWFVFPQLEGLGHSPTARHFALRDLQEARAYAAHPLLGARLRECVALSLGGWVTGDHPAQHAPSHPGHRREASPNPPIRLRFAASS